MKPSAAETVDEQLTRRRSLARYRKRAAAYDLTVGPTWSIRQRAIAALQLEPGQRVLDVGCGTGLSLSLLRANVGDTGSVHGIDQSPDMLAQARVRVADAGWNNVHVVECAAQSVDLPGAFDAMLFHYTHDILRSPVALARLLSCCRPGARISIAGIKYFPPWLAPLNVWVYLKNRAYNGAPGNLTAPWAALAECLDEWHWVPTQWGMGYLATGRARERAPGRSRHPVAAARPVCETAPGG